MIVALIELNIDFVILVSFIGLMISILVFSVFFSEKRKLIRFLNKLPEKRIGSLKINELVKVTGEVLATEAPFIAPLSKNNCVYYSFKIEEQRKRGKNSYWKTIVKEEKIQDFFIEERGGLLMVLAGERAISVRRYIVLDAKKVLSSKILNSTSDDLEMILKAYNIDDKYINPRKKIRCSEEIIAINQRITVVGNTVWKTLKKPIQNYSYSKIMSLKSTEKQRLIITDVIT